MNNANSSSFSYADLVSLAKRVEAARKADDSKVFQFDGNLAAFKVYARESLGAALVEYEDRAELHQIPDRMEIFCHPLGLEVHEFLGRCIVGTPAACQRYFDQFRPKINATFFH